MDCTEIKVEMAEEGLLEPLVITEEGDVTEGGTESGTASGSVVIVQSCSGESALTKKEEPTGKDKNEDDIASKMCLKEPSLEKQQTDAGDNQGGDAVVNKEDTQTDDKPDEPENMNDEQNTGDSNSEGQTRVVLRINEKPEKPSDTEEDKVTQNDPQVDIKTLNSSEQQIEGTRSQEEDPKKVCGLLLFYFDM